MQCVLTPDTEGYDQVLCSAHLAKVAIYTFVRFSYTALIAFDKAIIRFIRHYFQWWLSDRLCHYWSICTSWGSCCKQPRW